MLDVEDIMLQIDLLLRFMEDILRNAAWQIFVVMLVHSIFFLIDLLQAGPCPPDIARTMRRRLVGMLVLAAYILMWHRWVPSEPAYTLYSGAPGLAPPHQASAWLLSRLIPVTLLFVSLQAILEKPISKMCETSATPNRKWWNQGLFRLLHPGWPSGVVFAFVLTASFFALLVWRDYGTWKLYQLKHSGPVSLERTHLLHWQRASPAHWAAISALAVSPFVLWLGLLRQRVGWSIRVYFGLFLGMGILNLLLLLPVWLFGNQNLAKLTLPFPGMYWFWGLFKTPRAVPRLGEMVVSRLDWSEIWIAILTFGVWILWWLMALGLAFRAVKKPTGNKWTDWPAGFGRSGKGTSFARKSA